MEKNVFYDVSDKNIKIKCYNHDKNCSQFKKILQVIRKDDSNIYNLIDKNGQVILRCSGMHRIWCQNEKQYFHVSQIQRGIAINTNNENVEFFDKKTEQIQPIVDLQVQDNKNYFTNGVLSHNTTAGGKSLPYYSSIRVSLNGGSAGQKNADGQRITKVVKATVVKNKTYPPFKTAQFSIKFGTGVDKQESIIQGAIDCKIIQKAGAWIKMFGESVCQGMDTLKTKISQCNAISDLTQAVNEIIKNGKTLEEVKPIVFRNLKFEQKQKQVKEKPIKKTAKIKSDSVTTYQV